MAQVIDNRTRRPGTGGLPSPGRGPATFTAFGLAAEAEPLPPGLYVVATPIGNLGDISLRALQTLAAADAVLAEDTRVTRTLLAHYGITTPLVSYHEHSNDAVRERMILRIREGQALALVSDAGTPLVSDPGYRLVEAAIAEGLRVVPLPGASAALAALVVSGLPTDRFFFEGFLPAKSGARRTRLAELASIPGTLVLYEAPHRLAESLADAAAVLGPRNAAVARELTKLYETVRRGALTDLAEAYAAEPQPKGEIVLLIAPATAATREAETRATVDGKLRDALRQHSLKDAAALVAGETGLPKRDVYARALALSKEAPG
ncbi:16S rRNA (cytidine(1402)-2'-O)-methyltransferase [Enterovirga aerilata]|uniref:Ribosomal RNA small subunit methyltransferase I n=1 Tax=Enterovirga aerilata TaxID=2730920 RepID=A0A849IC44_9HYPH|nr:16S rRNA (cytidine(1402)-2'-O)-methyltransferase [Enterovirga sp. DB1703]NNM73547.1 16S rRNA (cytidine(1402)-2'-O)-methyltransferase [Enterovirga sp. DB1703]